MTPRNDIDKYLAALPDDARAALEKVRTAIRAAAPTAVESIAYGMPAYKYRGRPLVYFAASKNHCGIYGMAEVFAAHRRELLPYDTSKGTIRFPPRKPLPNVLIRKLVKARMAEIEAAESARGTKPRTVRVRS
jgi:uncharacterized protein YdhG (YjbR/CyaY superfamily)